MYVAATRAKDQLIMCYPGQESVPLWQLGDGVYRNGLSSFIRALPTDVVSHESAGVASRFSGRKWYESGAFNYQQDQKESSDLSQGDRVRHPAFGPGVVSKLISNDKVEVLFRNAGRKLLHLEYTTLERV